MTRSKKLNQTDLPEAGKHKAAEMLDCADSDGAPAASDKRPYKPPKCMHDKRRELW